MFSVFSLLYFDDLVLFLLHYADITRLSRKRSESYTLSDKKFTEKFYMLQPHIVHKCPENIYGKIK